MQVHWNNNPTKQWNDMKQTSGKCHPLLLQSHQGWWNQQHTIHQWHKDAGGAFCISWLFIHVKWMISNSNVIRLDLLYPVLAMVLDRHFGSWSRLNPNHCQVGGLDHQYTWIVNSGSVRQKYSNLAEFGGLSVHPSEDSYNVPVFAVCKYYLIKTTDSRSKSVILHVLQLAIWIILEAVFSLLYFVFLRIMAVNRSVVCATICAMTW